MSAKPQPAPVTDTASVLPILQQLHDLLLTKYQVLSLKGLQALPKLPADGKPNAELAVKLADDWHISLPTTSVQAVRDMQATVDELSPLLTLLVSVVDIVQNVVTANQGRSWQDAMLFYSVLSRVARKEPRLRAQLRPLRQAMSVKARQSKRRQAEESKTRSKQKRQTQKALTAQLKKGAGAAPSTSNGTTPAPAGNGVSNGAASTTASS